VAIAGFQVKYSLPVALQGRSRLLHAATIDCLNGRLCFKWSSACDVWVLLVYRPDTPTEGRPSPRRPIWVLGVSGEVGPRGGVTIIPMARRAHPAPALLRGPLVPVHRPAVCPIPDARFQQRRGEGVAGPDVDCCADREFGRVRRAAAGAGAVRRRIEPPGPQNRGRGWRGRLVRHGSSSERPLIRTAATSRVGLAARHAVWWINRSSDLRR
jgi:hypothetical protein